MRGSRWTVAALAVVLSVAGVALACSGAVPQPMAAAQPRGAFQIVPYPPPPGRVEYVPSRPNKQALWVSGQWRWTGGEWRWEHGGWYGVPDGVGFARWETKRDEDGRLLFAPPSWRDARGVEVAGPPLLARAGAGPETLVADAGGTIEEVGLDGGGLQDAPTMFDGPLFDAASLKEPLTRANGLLDEAGAADAGRAPDAHEARSDDGGAE